MLRSLSIDIEKYILIKFQINVLKFNEYFTYYTAI